MAITAASVWRDFVVDGNPASGAWNPQKADIRNLLAGMWSNSYLNINGIIYSVATGDAGASLVYTGNASNLLVYGSASGYAATHANFLVNMSTRTWIVDFSGVALQPALYPGQCAWVVNLNNTWFMSDPGRYRKANLILNVSNSGSDTTGDGLATGTGALATLQFAADLLASRIDTAHGTPTIQLAPGTYAPFFAAYPLVGRTQFNVRGDNSSFVNAANYIIQGAGGTQCVANRDLSTITLQGLKLQTTGNSSTGISTTNSCNIDLDTVIFGAFPLGTLGTAGTDSQINFLSGCQFIGNFTIGFAANGGGGVQMTSFTHNMPNALTFTTFCEAITAGFINGGCLFSGAGAGGGSAGLQYIVDSAGTIIGPVGGWTPPGSGNITTSPGCVR